MRSPLSQLVVLCLTASAAACGGDHASLPAAPSSPTPSPIVLVGTPTGSFAISGKIMERTAQGTRPLEGAGVNLWIDQGRSGYSYWWWSGKQYFSDAGGNFQLDRLPPSTAWFEAWKDGYVNQCAAAPISLPSDVLTVDATLVKRELAWTDVSAVPVSIPGRIVAGRIVENTADGVRPIAGAFIDFEPVMDYPAATTISNADGRYLLCGLNDGDIGVGLGSRVTYARVPGGTVIDNFDIVLP